MTPEGVLMRQIQVAASAQGHRLLRNNVGAYFNDATGRWIRYGVGGPGGADMIGWTRDGRFAAIEVKVGRRQPTAEQTTFILAVQAAGGRAGVARSVAEALSILAQPGTTI